MNHGLRYKNKWLEVPRTKFNIMAGIIDAIDTENVMEIEIVIKIKV